jgi:hypothetical protein
MEIKRDDDIKKIIIQDDIIDISDDDSDKDSEEIKIDNKNEMQVEKLIVDIDII